MKFNVDKMAHGCRLGILSDFKHCASEKVVHTPACLMYTKGGNVPCLSADLVSKIQHGSSMMQMPINLLAEHQENIRKFQKGIHSFTGNPDRIVYCCVQDPVQTVPSGYNDKHSSSVWTRSGRLRLDVDSFMDVQEALMPDVYEVLADSDTPQDASRKRVQKAFDRSLNFIDQCIDRHSKSERLKHTAILGVVGGGHIEEERIKSAKHIAKRPVQGFVIGGLHQFGADSEKFEIEDVKSLLTKSLSHLPDDLPRFLHGILKPHNVLHAIETGIDVIDSTYPYVAADRGCALCFTFQFPVSPPEEESDKQQPGYEIDLSDKVYFDDFAPLVASCRCYTCTTFNRSYVNHLLNTGELLGKMLLMVHNMQHYNGFMEQVRAALKSGRYEELRQIILSQDSDDKEDKKELCGNETGSNGGQKTDA